MNRQEFEKKTVYKMIRIYCKAHHHQKEGLCESCQDLFEYASKKYDKCPFGKNKPVCAKCKVHCYKRDRREEIKKVMRYAGPKMLFKHPVHTIVYLYHKWTIEAPDSVPKNTLKVKPAKITVKNND